MDLNKRILFGFVYILFFMSGNVVYASETAISFQEALSIALENNFDILIAKNIRKASLLSNRVSTLHIWFPKATFKASQENNWQKDSNSFYFKSDPLFTLTWDLQSISDKIFQTKIYCGNNALNNLLATKAISSELERVVTAYYELALAQKKFALSDTFVKIASSRLEIEKKKFNLGFVPKTNYLNADLGLKEAHLSLLEEEETLKEKRRNLNLMLGRPLGGSIVVEASIPVEPIWDIDSSIKEQSVNIESLIQEKRVGMALTELRKAKCYPLSCLSLSVSFLSKGYAYNLKDKVWNNRPLSQLMNISVSIDLGSLLLMPVEISKARRYLDTEKSKLNKEKLSGEGSLENKKWLYDHALGLHTIAVQRLKISKQKLAFVQEAYDLNQVKLLELQQAEEDLQKSEINLITYAFKVKQAEFALYRLVGMFDQ